MVKKLGLSLVLAWLTSVSTTAQAVTWSYLTSSADDTSFYYDADSVKVGTFSNGNKFLLAWEKWTFPASDKPKLADGTPYDHLVIQRYYDCTDKKTISGDNHAYDKKGSVVHSYSPAYLNSYSSSRWNNVIPSSVGESMLETLCQIYLMK